MQEPSSSRTRRMDSVSRGRCSVQAKRRCETAAASAARGRRGRLAPQEGNEMGREKVSIISVFGSSRAAEEGDDYRLAKELGAELARAGFSVASGGYGGTMEAV